MANCVFCGKWAGIFADKHDDCAKLAAAGRTPQQIRAAFAAAKQADPLKPLTAWSVFWAIFGALWLFSLTAGVVYAILRALNS